jgi:hypothetical protein
MKTKQVTPAFTPKKRGRPRKDAVLTPVNKKETYSQRLEAEILELHGFCLEWRAKCDKQEAEIARIQHLCMDNQAIVRYLESKIAQLLK